MNLRPMTQDDLAQVVAIHERITRTPVTPHWRKMLSQHVDNPCLPGLVAEENGNLVGFIIGEIKVGGFGANISGWIEMVGVKPDHMGSGIGGALAQGLIKYFRRQEVDEVFTSVRWDSGDMLAFFKNQGFDRSPYINLRLKLKE